VSLTVGPISGVEHLAFVQFQRSVSFLQTPAWSRVKTVWRSESLGWYDGRRLVGAGLVPAPPGAAARALHACLPGGGPGYRLDRRIDTWLDPLAAYLKAQVAFAIRLGASAHETPGDRSVNSVCLLQTVISGSVHHCGPSPQGSYKSRACGRSPQRPWAL
jgi:lipid II:glycine glycyltransferase (peptidoglycan interpeptide bridge formation enzyme)